MQSFDAIVVGAGIIGCACALECAQAGLRVGIVEAEVPGGGATAAGMGHIVVMDDSPAQLAISNYSRSLWRELVPQLPAVSEFEPRGTVWVAADDEEMAEVYVKQKTYAAVNVNSVVLDSKDLAAAEPSLRPGLAGGLLVPDDAVIYPPTAAAYFLQQCEALGSKFIRGSAAVSAANGEVRLANGTVLKAGIIIVATGADLKLLPWLPILKRKGHLLITDRYPGFLHHQLVELGYLKSAHKISADSVAFNIQPRRTGQMLIGSSRQYGNDYHATDQAILARMLERSIEYIPSLRNISGIRVWTGFRAATPDKLPMIGPTQDPTLFLAVGFEGLGITNAPGSARILADQILKRTSAIDVTPYLPSRSSLTEAAHA